MTIMVHNVGLVRIAEYAFGQETMGNLSLRLFVNNVTQAKDDILSDYTEMTTNGYAAIPIPLADWTISLSGTQAESLAETYTFTFTAGSPVSVYGYMIVDASDGTLIESDKFDTPKTVRNTGDSILITPRMLFADKGPTP